MSIPFTQYLRPNGRTKEVMIDMPADIELKAGKLIESGCHFDIEVLSTGIISMTCEREDDVLAIRLSTNGPEVPIAVGKLIDDATAKLEMQ